VRGEGPSEKTSFIVSRVFLGTNPLPDDSRREGAGARREYNEKKDKGGAKLSTKRSPTSKEKVITDPKRVEA